MQIPPYLLDQIAHGKVMLFLGAGAVKGARNNAAEQPPDGNQLKEMICDHFLGGEEKHKTLQGVADLAISESDFQTFQEWLKDIFIQFNPGDVHKLITSFKWSAIATTNYDLILERAYAENVERANDLVPFIKDTDRIDAKLRDQNSLPYVKLHGCITKWDDREIPLIITVDQYVNYRKKRGLLFSRAKEYLAEYPCVFVGHSLEDSDLRNLLLEITEEGFSRPRHYLVIPNISDREIRYWEGKTITGIRAKFDEFLTYVDEHTDKALRRVDFAKTKHPLEGKIVTKEREFSSETLKILENDVDYVRPGLPAKEVSASDFYKGYSYGWSHILNKYDSHRGVCDTILSDVILVDDVDRENICDFYLVKGPAGSGKKTILKRIAWDSSESFGKVCLYWKSRSRINYETIFELCDKTNERIYLFVEKASQHSIDLNYLIEKSRQRKKKITVICSERTNEWNIECGNLDSIIDNQFEVRRLSRNEIINLLEKLEENKCLNNLDGLTREQQIKAFEDKAGRHLLVSLYEVTLGGRFEDLVVDEFNRIRPELASQIYLTVCVLNRLDASVRAGIVNRIHGVSFEDFKERFFEPLESVVFAQENKAARTMTYVARHPQIAEFVFQRLLPNADERFQYYIKIINCLDTGYEADRRVYRRFINTRELRKIFADPNMINRIFEESYGLGKEDPYYYQQRAIFEYKKSVPDFDKAYEYLVVAKRKCSFNDRSIQHTIAELEVARANSATTEIEREKHLESAVQHAKQLTDRAAENAYGYHTLCKVALEKLRKAIEETPDNSEQIGFYIDKAEMTLSQGLQRFPDESYLLESEAQLAGMLKDEKRVLIALEKALKLNPHSPYLTKSLSTIYTCHGEIDKARKLLEGFVEENPTSKDIKGALGRFLVEYFQNEGESIEYHLRGSFTDGDTNYGNQFWYARQLFINNKYEQSKKYFSQLKAARLSSYNKNKIRGLIRDKNGEILTSHGYLVKIESTYAFINDESWPIDIFLHRRKAKKGVWEKLSNGARVKYNVGFTFGGVGALNADICL